jgi:hypothetical protein
MRKLPACPSFSLRVSAFAGTFRVHYSIKRSGRGFRKS